MEEKNSYEPEIDFKKLPKTPLRLFGWIFPYYAVLFLILGIYFVKHMDYSSFNSVPAIYTDSLKITADVEVKKGGVSASVDLSQITDPTQDFITKGKQLFTTTCSSCHGTDGKGDGPAAAALNPKPRNFHQTDGWTNGRKFTNIFNTIKNGVPNSGMASFDYLPTADRIAIIQYIRTFADFPEVTKEEADNLDQTYGLSKGEVTPNTITLEMAADKIAEESIENIDIKSVISKLESENTPGVELLNQYALNKEQIVTIFNRDFAKNKDVNLFINQVIVSPKANGFKPDIVSLSKDKLTQLYNVLLKALS